MCVCVYVCIRYEIIYVYLREKAPEWLKDRHPSGFVPVLERDGRIVYESMVCSQYVDDVFPQLRVTPNDAYEKAIQMMLLIGFDKVV